MFPAPGKKKSLSFITHRCLKIPKLFTFKQLHQLSATGNLWFEFPKRNTQSTLHMLLCDGFKIHFKNNYIYYWFRYCTKVQPCPCRVFFFSPQLNSCGESNILQVGGAFHSLRHFTVHCGPPPFCPTWLPQRRFQLAFNF